MAIRITGPTSFTPVFQEPTGSTDGGRLILTTNSPLAAGSVSISFDAHTDSFWSVTNRVQVHMNGTTEYFNVTSKSISYDISSFDDLITASDGNSNGGFYFAPQYTMFGMAYGIGGDVYYNGTRLGYANEGASLTPFRVYVVLNPAYYSYADSISDITGYNNTDYHGYLVAGITIPQITNIHVTNSVSNDDNTSFTVTATPAGTITETSTQNYSWVRNYNNTIPANSEDTTYSVDISVRNKRYVSNTVTKTASVKGYHIPRLVVNTSGDNSYASRCDVNGNADGLGEYGKLHLKWEVSTIDPVNPNDLRTVTVVLNDTTTLTPTQGSISDGYIDYIFPLDISTQGNLKITLTDDLRTNNITSLVVPKGAMPLSLFDAGGDQGVAFGRMATQSGAWVYMPLYIQSYQSTRMFRLKISDAGVITAEQVT